MIVVHHLDDSRSQRILWLLEELGLPYDIVQHRRDPTTRLAPPELKQVHPLGKSPVIEDDGHVVAESGAIIDYILRRYGHGRLQPAPSSPSYDDYVHWMHYAEGSAMPALIIRLSVARVGEDAASVLPRLDAEIALHLRYIDGRLDGRSYPLGDELTAADIQLSFVGELAAARFGIANYPNVAAWVACFQARPASRAALATAIGRFTEVIGLSWFALYIFDHRAPTGLRLASRIRSGSPPSCPRMATRMSRD